MLLVSHDRQLISESCNRFWLIDGAGLTEWRRPGGGLCPSAGRGARPGQSARFAEYTRRADDDEEALLARLIDLEQWLADDMARKPKHQKPSLQAQWRGRLPACLTN